MPDARSVNPHAWSEVTVLFDNGWYSVISGKYQGDKPQAEWSLGERWNGRSGKVGFPNQAGYPIWHVVPDFVAIPVLHGLLDELGRNPVPEADEFADQISLEIREWQGDQSDEP